MKKEKDLTITTFNLLTLGTMVYPIMLAQQAGEISEQKAAELIGLGIERYREEKGRAVLAILRLVESLPSPLLLLLDPAAGGKK